MFTWRLSFPEFLWHKTLKYAMWCLTRSTSSRLWKICKFFCYGLLPQVLNSIMPQEWSILNFSLEYHYIKKMTGDGNHWKTSSTKESEARDHRSWSLVRINDGVCQFSLKFLFAKHLMHGKFGWLRNVSRYIKNSLYSLFETINGTFLS